MKRFLLAVICFLGAYPFKIVARDIFNEIYEPRHQPEIKHVSLARLLFLGRVEELTGSTGFVQEKGGPIFTIRVGDIVGETKAKVLDILNDKIVLADDLSFLVIK